MKHIIITILTLNIALQSKAQDTCAQFDWVNTSISSNENRAGDIHSDAEGNTYTTGYFEQNITFGSITLSSTGKRDMYVVKTNPQGQVLWATQAGGIYLSSEVVGNEVATDALGNCYVGGYFLGAVSIGSTNFTNLSGYSKVFITKLNPQGQFEWAINIDSVQLFNNLVSDAQGNSFIYGRLLGTATFGSTTLSLSQYNDIFVAKINTQGQFEWAVTVGGGRSSPLTPTGISLDMGGNMFISGYFTSDTAYIGSYIYNHIGVGQHFYIAKLNPQGQALWANFSNKLTIAEICADNQNNCYISGAFKDSITFGNISLTGNAPNTNTAYIAKLAPNGQYVAAVKVGSDGLITSNSGAARISTDTKGNCYLMGGFRGTAILGNTVLVSDLLNTFITKLNTQELTFDWAIISSKRVPNFQSVIDINKLTNDSAGNCYFTGFIRDSIYLGNTLIYSNNDNSYIAKVSTECPTDITILKKNTVPIKVYPNPVQGNGFNLILSEQYQNYLLEINIYDITGRKLHNQKGSIEDINLYLSNITTNTAKGLWTIQIISHTSGKSESVRVSVR